MAQPPVEDIIELQQVLAKYSVAMTKGDIDTVVGEVFAPGGSYSAFGSTYELPDFPALVASAPQGLYMTSPAHVELDPVAGTGTGEQPLLFVDQTDHSMRMGWYTDTYVRTDDGWRLQTRSMTFLRRSGGRDAGKPHDPRRPDPATTPVGE